MKTYEITLAEQDAIPGHSPAGVVPMSLCFRDVDQDDDFYQLRAGKPLPSGGGWKRGLLLMVVFR